MSHVILTCTCPSTCEVPGHGDVALLVDPQTLVDAGMEALGHLNDAVWALMKARAAWVSRGLPGDNPFPLSLDRLAESITYKNQRLLEWTVAAKTVAKNRVVSYEGAAPGREASDG